MTEELGICAVCLKEASIYNLLYGEKYGDLFKEKDVCDSCLNKQGATNCSSCGGIFRVEDVDDNYVCRSCHRKHALRAQINCMCEICTIFTSEEIQSAKRFDPDILSRDTFSMNFKVNCDA